jgi:hypothetical protein
MSTSESGTIGTTAIIGAHQHQLRVERQQAIAGHRRDEVEGGRHRAADVGPRPEQAERQQRLRPALLHRHEQGQGGRAAQQDHEAGRLQPALGELLDHQERRAGGHYRQHGTGPVHGGAVLAAGAGPEVPQAEDQPGQAHRQDHQEQGAPAELADQQAAEHQPRDLGQRQDRGVDGHGPAPLLLRKDGGDLGHHVGQHQAAAHPLEHAEGDQGPHRRRQGA